MPARVRVRGVAATLALATSCLVGAPGLVGVAAGAATFKESPSHGGCQRGYGSLSRAVLQEFRGSVPGPEARGQLRTGLAGSNLVFRACLSDAGYP